MELAEGGVGFPGIEYFGVGILKGFFDGEKGLKLVGGGYREKAEKREKVEAPVDRHLFGGERIFGSVGRRAWKEEKRGRHRFNRLSAFTFIIILFLLFVFMFFCIVYYY